MPFAVDEQALESPDLKILDLSRPPMKSIPHMEFPMMLYLHPKDKTKESRTRIVASKEEKDAAIREGWRTRPHIPEAPPDPTLAEFEYEAPEAEVKRGPGRPTNAELAARRALGGDAA